MKINEAQLRKMISESLKELDWKTYSNAAKKAQKYREENPFKYDRNRGAAFDRAAQDSFDRQHGIDNLPDFGGERGNINFNSFHGEPTLSGSRDHDFGDGGGPFDLRHHVYHMGKQYGKDGKYGRTRMYDFSHETTPEEFYDDDEMGQKFRDAEQDVEAYKNGDYEYSNDKGWHLKESQLRQIIRESLKRVVNEGVYEYSQDIDDDTYYGGGLPEGEPKANVYSEEQNILKVFKEMEPYIDKIADICNNSECTMPGIDDKMFQILNSFDEIPRLAKYFQTTELP